MKKLVLKLDLHDDKSKQKAMKTVSRLSGIDSISIDMKDQKLTVIGDVDPIEVVTKLRKGNWNTDLLSVGPAKEEKKDQQGGKKDDAKKDDKKKDPNEQTAELLKLYKSNPYATPYYHASTIEENPNACVIC